MALRRLQQELEEFKKFLDNNKAVREAAGEKHFEFHFTQEMIRKQVTEIRNKFNQKSSKIEKRFHEAGAKKHNPKIPTDEQGGMLTTGRGQRLISGTKAYDDADYQFAFGPGDQPLIKRFAKRFFDELHTQCKAAVAAGKSEASHTAYFLDYAGEDIFLTAVAKAGKNPDVTAAVTRIVSRTEEILFTEGPPSDRTWVKIFTKGSHSPGKKSIVNVGHIESIAATKAAIVQQFVAEEYNNLPKTGAKYAEKVEKIVGKFPIEMSHKVDVNFKKGSLDATFILRGDIQSFDENMKGVGHTRETQLGGSVYSKKKQDNLVDELLAEINTDLTQRLFTLTTTEELSTPFITMLGGMFTQLPSIRRLQKLGVAINLSKYTKNPKTKKPIKATGDAKFERQHRRIEVSNMLGASRMKGSKKGQGMQGGQASRAPQNLAQLPALINARLAETVVSNMGDPALVNRTGAFAASVRVAAATGSAGGVPNLSYTYNKNPYEVFEMGGRGRQPWATEGRDPRNVIDKSIREIATEMALGALTLRRV